MLTMETELSSRTEKAIWPVYSVQGIGSISANLMLVGIFFFTQQQFRWTLTQNLLLASGQGAFYVLGALSADTLSRRLGPRGALLTAQLLMIALAIAAMVSFRPSVIAAALLIYSAVSATQWPVLESLTSAGVSGARLSRRLSAYNLVWSSTGAVTVALCGTVIQNWPAGLFLLAAIGNTLMAVLVIFSGDSFARSTAAAHLEPEPELIPMRTRALWLARIAMPASYVAVYSLSAMMPSLPVLRPLDTQWRTIVGSVWLVARFGTFLLLGMTVFWHTRPRLMLLAAIVMLVAFLGVGIRPGDLAGVNFPHWVNLLSMMLWQILLGASMGLIYSASLYFGMVLSQGSTEHGGYHEALIGFGSSVGTAAAAAAHALHPTGIALSAITVASLIGLSVIASSVISIGLHRSPRLNAESG